MARKWWTLIAVSVATFMLLLDITVVNTALPSIEKDLSASFSDLQWVIDAYTLALAVTYGRLRESRAPNATRIDWLGLATLSGALFMLVLGLLRGNDEGWGSPVILGLLGGAAILLPAFLAVERRVPEPMLPLGLFRNRAFTGVQLGAFAVSASLFALFLYLTLYLQDYLGYSPLEAGVRYLPITIASFVAAPIAGALLGRVQARVLMSLGLFGTGAGLLLMSGLQTDSGWTALLPGFLVAG